MAEASGKKINLSKNELMLLYVAVVFIIAAVFDRMIFHIISLKLRSLDEDIKTQELVIKKDLRTLSQKEKILGLDKQYSNYSVKAKTQEEEISGILREIETKASSSQVVLIDAKPSGVTDEKFIKKYAIIVSCEGSLEQLANFISAIETSTKLFAIDNYVIVSRDREKGIVRCSMAISKIVMP